MSGPVRHGGAVMSRAEYVGREFWKLAQTVRALGDLIWGENQVGADGLNDLSEHRDLTLNIHSCPPKQMSEVAAWQPAAERVLNEYGDPKWLSFKLDGVSVTFYRR